MVDYKGAIWSPNSNFFPDTGKKTFVILHGTAGGSSAQGIANFFQGTEGSGEPVSSHYIVGQDGTVVQTVSEKDGSYANGVVNSPNWGGNPNYYTISIEHVKSDDANVSALTSAQKQASFALIKDICQRNGIGMHDADDSTGITGHFAIDPINRARCPNTYPWSELWAYLSGQSVSSGPITLENSGMYTSQSNSFSTYFTEKDKDHWVCKKNGNVVQFGIKGLYEQLTIDGDSLPIIGLPTSNEINTKVNGKNVVLQFYERGVAAYDDQHTLDSQPGLAAAYLAKYDDPVVAKLDPNKKP
jgi:N-acetyl-anhydromuramyl-L-alanine amidase AmpD